LLPMALFHPNRRGRQPDDIERARARRELSAGTAVSEELVEVGLDAFLARIFDGLNDRLGARLRVFPQNRHNLFEPPVRRPLSVANADLGVLICAPDDPVAADIVEEEKAGPERRLTDLGVPHEEAAGERPEPASSAVRQLDAVFFVGEKHEHVAIARVEGRVVLGDSHPFAELTRHAPLPRDAVAKFLNEGVDYFGIIDASIVGAVDGPELVDTAVLVRGEEDADVFGRLGSRFARSVGRACYRTVARDKSRSRNFWKSVLVDK